MNPISIGREFVSAWALMASYPLDCLTILQARIPRRFRRSRDAVILIHGNGGDRTNLLAMSILLRLNGFDNIGFFTYSARQSVEVSSHSQRAAMRSSDSGSRPHSSARRIRNGVS